jgi:hypothetical protein
VPNRRAPQNAKANGGQFHPMKRFPSKDTSKMHPVTSAMRRMLRRAPEPAVLDANDSDATE